MFIIIIKQVFEVLCDGIVNMTTVIFIHVLLEVSLELFSLDLLGSLRIFEESEDL